MKKIILALTFLTLTPHLAHAACTANAITYTSCNAGYYKSGSSCVACGTGTWKSTSGTATSCSSCGGNGSVSATTSSTATTAQTSCYIPSSSSWTFSDTKGSGSEHYTSNCYYK